MLFCFLGHNFEWYSSFSVIRLIQQYLKESNLIRTLQTLQVTFAFRKLTNAAPNLFVHCIKWRTLQSSFRGYVKKCGWYNFLTVGWLCVPISWFVFTIGIPNWPVMYDGIHHAVSVELYNNCNYRFSESSRCNSRTIFTSPSLMFTGKEIICFPWT